jgi:hypothetical protein
VLEAARDILQFEVTAVLIGHGGKWVADVLVGGVSALIGPSVADVE